MLKYCWSVGLLLYCHWPVCWQVLFFYPTLSFVTFQNGLPLYLNLFSFHKPFSWLRSGHSQLCVIIWEVKTSAQFLYQFTGQAVSNLQWSTFVTFINANSVVVYRQSFALWSVLGSAGQRIGMMSGMLDMGSLVHVMWWSAWLSSGKLMYTCPIIYRCCITNVHSNAVDLLVLSSFCLQNNFFWSEFWASIIWILG